MATKSDKGFDFGAKLKELEAISGELEGQDLDLERGITQYEAGMRLIKDLKEHLEAATNRVEEIKRQYSAPAAHEDEPAVDDTDESYDSIPF